MKKFSRAKDSTTVHLGLKDKDMSLDPNDVGKLRNKNYMLRE